MKYLVTGATGFIGGALCARLADAQDTTLVATARSPGAAGMPHPGYQSRELGPDTRWEDLLDSVDVVVHTAARVHVVHGPDPQAEYRRTNVDGTLNLARQAAECGVQRFVFLSSVKVNGENTLPGQAFGADDRPAPVDAYGESKYAAELALAQLTKEHAMDCVAIRPPLVYGPGVKANFLELMRWVYKGYPLPFARIHNLRSLVALDNLVDLIRVCSVHPQAANETFMAADEKDVSIAELLIRLGVALHRPARLLPMPRKLLLALAKIGGRRDQAKKLMENLQVDTRKTRSLLDWKPAIDMDHQLEATAKHFLETLR